MINSMTLCMERLALYTISKDKITFDIDQFSLFKHGEHEATNFYALKLAKHFISSYKPHECSEIVFASSAYRNIPVAATLLTHLFIRHLEDLTGNKYKIMRLYRQNLTKGDFSTMSLANRSRTMQSTKIKIKGRKHLKKNVVVIDDIIITGSHERRLQQLFYGEDISSLTFLYLVEVLNVGEKTSFENELNKANMNNWEQWLSLALKDPLVTVRFLKFLMQIDSQYYPKIIAALGKERCKSYKLCIKADGLNKQFIENYKSLCTLLKMK